MCERRVRLQGKYPAVDAVLRLSEGKPRRLGLMIRPNMGSKLLVEQATKEELGNSWWGNGLKQVEAYAVSSAYLRRQAATLLARHIPLSIRAATVECAANRLCDLEPAKRPSVSRWV